MDFFNFAGLPQELKDKIVSRIYRPSDLVSLCLVSKDLNKTAMAFLYSDVGIDVSVWSRQEVADAIAHGHRGHCHIRSLDIGRIKFEWFEIEVPGVVEAVVSRLPRNRLNAFRCRLPMDRGILTRLVENQNEVESLTLATQSEDFFDLALTMPPWPPSVKTLVIPMEIKGLSGMSYYRRLIERSAGRLSHLRVTTGIFHGITTELGFPIERGSLNLARGLFLHHLPLGSKEPMVLDRLDLENQDLWTCGGTWPRFVDFRRLRTLTVRCCNGMDELFRALRKYRLALKGLILYDDEFLALSQDGERFIKPFGGLEYLNYYIYNQPDERPRFDIQTLQNHKTTLKDLSLGIFLRGTEHRKLYRPSLADVEWLSVNCTRLRQLAIGLPDLRTDDAFAGRWGDCGTALEMLARLPRLKFLRILSWPLASCRSFGLARYRDESVTTQMAREYFEQLDVVAKGIASLFARLRGPDGDRLSVITFGTTERHLEPLHVDGSTLDPFPMPIAYKVRQVQGEFGVLIETERIDADVMQYVEPMGNVMYEGDDRFISLEGLP